jgi:hypothetical protein
LRLPAFQFLHVGIIKVNALILWIGFNILLNLLATLDKRGRLNIAFFIESIRSFYIPHSAIP